MLCFVSSQYFKRRAAASSRLRQMASDRNRCSAAGVKNTGVFIIMLSTSHVTHSSAGVDRYSI